MTKTELKKQQVKEAIELLETKFGAKFIGDDDGGRLAFMVGDFMAQFSRRDMSVALWDSTPLYGSSWPVSALTRQKKAYELEVKMNTSIRGSQKSISYIYPNKGYEKGIIDSGVDG